MTRGSVRAFGCCWPELVFVADVSRAELRTRPWSSLTPELTGALQPANLTTRRPCAVNGRGTCTYPACGCGAAVDPGRGGQRWLTLPCCFQAYERRFPTCHLIPMFVASDVINEETSEDGSSHRVERRCALDVDAPRLLKRVRCAWLLAALLCTPE